MITDLVQIHVSVGGDRRKELKPDIDKVIRAYGYSVIRLGSYRKIGIDLKSIARLIGAIFDTSRTYSGTADIQELVISGGVDVLVTLRKPQKPARGRAR